MKYIMLIIKGFIIGIAKIIPGVSGAVIAISFGVYERIVKIMSSPTKLNINDIKFLLCLLIGAASGIGLLCKFVKLCLETSYLPTMLLFCGLIYGGIPEIIHKIPKKKKVFKEVIIFFICFLFLYYIVNVHGRTSGEINNIFIYFIIGMIESVTTIIPGISGTAIFMALGWYETLINLFEGIATFNINFLIISLFLAGFIITTIIISKVISFLFSQYTSLAYSGVLGFMFSSLIIMFKDIFNHEILFFDLIIGIFLFIFGWWLTKKINVFFANSKF